MNYQAKALAASGLSAFELQAIQDAATGRANPYLQNHEEYSAAYFQAVVEKSGRS